MSFEDLVKARTKRAEKETNDLAKNRRSHSRKRKDGIPEACVLDPVIDIRYIENVTEPARSSIQSMESCLMPSYGRAPVARMYQQIEEVTRSFH